MPGCKFKGLFDSMRLFARTQEGITKDLHRFIYQCFSAYNTRLIWTVKLASQNSSKRKGFFDSEKGQSRLHGRWKETV